MSAAAKPSSGDAKRRAMLAKYHIAMKALGIEGDARKAFLKESTGRESAAELNAQQLGEVLDRLRKLGFRSPRTSEPNQRPGEPQERLMYAIYRDLGRLPGVLKDPSDAGLRKFAASLVKVDRLEWLTPGDANKVIEALKAWLRREREKRQA